MSVDKLIDEVATMLLTSAGRGERPANRRLENPGKVPLHLVEVQSGGYLGEDDIVRFEDLYRRA